MKLTERMRQEYGLEQWAACMPTQETCKNMQKVFFALN